MSREMRAELRRKLEAVEAAANAAYRAAVESEGAAGDNAASCLSEVVNAARDALKGLEIIP